MRNNQFLVVNDGFRGVSEPPITLKETIQKLKDQGAEARQHPIY